MKATKGTILAAVFLGLSCLTSSFGSPSDTSCSINIPAGTIIRVYPDERIVAGTTSGPLLFTVAADVRFFPNKPPILQRGAKILGKMESSSQAGRLWGRANAHLAFTSILTPDFCEYAIDARLIEARKYQVHEDVISGRGHARRDAFALLFPPTTLYQLIRLPARGPKLTIREEEQLVLKLLEPVYLARSELNQTGVAAPIAQTRQSAATFATAAKPQAVECPKISGSRIAVPAPTATLRAFQNTTPYDVAVYANGFPVGRIAPCAESVLFLPRGRLKLKAIATVPEDNGQSEVEAELGLNENTTGWQVLALHEKVSKIR